MGASQVNLRSGWIVLGLLAASAPGAPEELPSSDHDALMEVQELSRQALLAADAAGLVALFEEGAVLMPPGAPAVVGCAAIQAFWEAGPPVERFEIDVLEIGGDGDVAYVRGTYLMTFTGAPIERPDAGLSISLPERKEE